MASYNTGRVPKQSPSSLILKQWPWQVVKNISTCLLYTSDAADEGLGVDLGGRRIIKKNFFQAEDGIRDCLLSRGLGDVYKRQVPVQFNPEAMTLTGGQEY